MNGRGERRKEAGNKKKTDVRQERRNTDREAVMRKYKTMTKGFDIVGVRNLETEGVKERGREGGR